MERYGSRVLSKRERDVVRLVAAGLKNREIGLELGVSEHVVKNYLRGIFDKLGMWNRVEVALWYVARQ